MRAVDLHPYLIYIGSSLNDPDRVRRAHGSDPVSNAMKHGKAYFRCSCGEELWTRRERGRAGKDFIRAIRTGRGFYERCRACKRVEAGQEGAVLPM